MWKTTRQALGASSGATGQIPIRSRFSRSDRIRSAVEARTSHSTCWSMRQLTACAWQRRDATFDYTVVMTNPRSIRLESPTEAMLAGFVARRPGLSLSSAVALLVDEGLRSDAHPGILFREGPAGRRAVVAGGPDVWEVIAAVQSARAAEPGLDAEALLDLVTDTTGIAERHLRLALDYYSSFPDEVDARLRAAQREEEELTATLSRRSELLGG